MICAPHPHALERKPWLRAISALLLPPVFLTSGPVPLLAAMSSPAPVSAGAPVGIFSGEQAPAPVLTSKNVKRNPGVGKINPPVLKLQLPEDPKVSDLQAVRGTLRPMRCVGKAASEAENKALAAALKTYEANGAHTSVDSLTALQQFREAYPQSSWKPAVCLQLGSVYWRNGYFTKALESFREGWGLVKDSPQTLEVRDQLLVELLRLAARLGRISLLQEILGELEGKAFGGTATAAIERAHEALYFYLQRPEPNISCGIAAINAACRTQEGFEKLVPDVHDAAEEAEFKANGLSLHELFVHSGEGNARMQLGQRSGHAEIPVPAVMHMKIGHYAAITERSGDKYRLVDNPSDFDAWVTSAALNEEGSGYFLLPAGPLPAGWASVSEATAKQIYGRHCTHGRDDDDDQTKRGGPCPDGSSQPMASHTFRMLDAGLVVQDTPISYRPPYGPSVQLQVTYDQKSTGLPTSYNFSNLGPRWAHSWMTYIEITGSGTPPSQVKVVYGDGNHRLYEYQSGAYQAVRGNPASLAQISSTEYEITYPDGSKMVYAQPDASPATRIFITEYIDPHGQALTFTYDSSLRLVEIEDALGDPTTFSYTPHPNDPVSSNTMLIRTVTDPFSRVAKFEYDASGRLIKITDPINVVSEFQYDTSDFITHLTTPYGTTQFRNGQFTGANPGGPNRFIEATYPNGDIEHVEASDTAKFPEDTANPPATTINVAGVNVPFSIYNGNLHYRNTYHWDRKAWGSNPGDHTKARVYHWVADGSTNKTLSILESYKDPFEERVWFNYPGQAGATQPGTFPLPSKIARVVELPNGTTTTQLHQRAYNANGNLTTAIDPLGRETVLEYYSNGQDLQRVKQKNGSSYETLLEFGTYTNHLPASVTDAAGQTTQFSWNSRGQLTSVTNAKSETTTYNYDTNGYLTSIDGPLSGTADSIVLTYDGYGRIETLTDTEGYTLTYDYDDIDRLTKITYEDNSYEQFNYKWMHREWYRSRDGRWTRFFVNSLQQLVARRDPRGAITRFDWCRCGDLKAITDALGNVTRWTHDAQGRVTSKIFSDNSTIAYAYEPLSGRLQSVTDALAQIKRYRYNIDDRLESLDYQDEVVSTPDVSFTYDTPYGRLDTIVDGTGTTSYAYHPVDGTTLGAGKLNTIDGPLGSDTVTYTYDELGRVKKRQINSTANETEWFYDALGRIDSITNPIGSFDYAHVDATPRLASVSLPNGTSTVYDYFEMGESTGDRDYGRLAEIKNLGTGGTPPVISKFNYAYDLAGRITTWRQQAGDTSTDAKEYSFEYDPVGQLIAANLRNHDASQVLQTYAYRYDHAGNRVSEQIGPHAITGSTFNSLNQLTGQSAGGKLRVEGVTDEAAKVDLSANGGPENPATVDGSNNFVGSVDVQPGTNTIQVKATDYSPNQNVTTKSYQVIVTGGATRTLTYDLNGNLVHDDIGTPADANDDKRYVWDADNRVVKVYYNSSSATDDDDRTEFTYDGLGRRVKIEEFTADSSTSVKRYVWCGLDICEERASDGTTVNKRFFPQGFEVGSTDRFYAKDHLGSIREVVNSSGTVDARYDYDPYGRRTLVSGSDLADFAFTGHFYHSRSGLHLAPFRAYDADLGRWTSRDPIAEDGGLNLYAYAAGDPINYVDRTGLFANPGTAVGAGIGSVLPGPGTVIGAAIGTIAVYGLILWATSDHTDGECGEEESTAGDNADDDDDEEEEEYKPTNRERKRENRGEEENMGGEDPDPFGGKGPKKGTDEYERARRELEKMKEKSGRGGKNNINPNDPSI